MKEKMFFRMVLVAGAATMLAACTSESENGPSANFSYESIAATQQVPVTFGTYIGDQATTRAGTAGNIADAQDLAANKDGFGVFAYYTFTGTHDADTGATDNGTYGGSNGSETTKPNFMYNQHVTGTNVAVPVWSYTPIKYWPNDFATGAVDAQTSAATGSKVSNVSFFAYAPYVATASATGPTGITAFTGNNTAGDPKVSYTIATTPDAAVDLLWGVSGTSTASVLGGGAQSTSTGLPFLNQKKQETDGNISFLFKHALARLGLMVQAARDQVDAGPVGVGDKELWEASDPAHKTKIFVNSVTITAPFNISGDLNLNNTTANVANWGSLNADSDPGTAGVQPTTLTVSGDNLNTDLKYVTTPVTALGSQPAGVLAKSSTPLIKNGANLLYFMLIPTDFTSTDITITIDYTVKTLDASLAAGESTVNNVITKVISGINFQNNNAYTLNLVLGMTSVRVTATVDGWGNGGSTQVDLPLNVN